MTKKTSTHLQTRRQAIAAGALDVLAEQGTHKLTHRSVDRHLGLPQGSTSYYFNSREALLMAAADALVRGDLPEAETRLRARLARQPGDVAALRMLAELAARLGRNDASLGALSLG